MAIRFVDVEPEEREGDEPAPRRRARVSDDAAQLEAPAAAVPDAASAEAPSPDPAILPHAKPEPKPRGRKKPMSAVGADKQKEQKEQKEQKGAKTDDLPSAPLLEGLLPELQAHAKPPPKPRGRKKAFG